MAKRKLDRRTSDPVASGDLAAASTEILKSVDDPLLGEILTPTTRQCRRALLAASVVAFTLTWGGLVPERIEAFGLSIEQIERANLLYVLALVTGYFTVTFISYCYSDGTLRRIRVRLSRIMPGLSLGPIKASAERLRETPAENLQLDSPEFLATTSIADHMRAVQDVHRAARLRMVIDVYLPAAVGLGASAVAIQEAGRLPGIPVLIAFVLLVSVFVTVLVVQSEKFRNFRRLLPMRRLTGDLKDWVELKKKLLTLNPNSWRAKRIRRRLERSKFGLGSMDVGADANQEDQGR
jgi:hypothetical protein